MRPWCRSEPVLLLLWLPIDVLLLPLLWTDCLSFSSLGGPGPPSAPSFTMTPFPLGSTHSFFPLSITVLTVDTFSLAVTHIIKILASLQARYWEGRPYHRTGVHRRQGRHWKGNSHRSHQFSSWHRRNFIGLRRKFVKAFDVFYVTASGFSCSS